MWSYLNTKKRARKQEQDSLIHEKKEKAKHQM